MISSKSFSHRVKFLNSLPLLTVHPVPAPPSTNEEATNKINAGGNNQKLILFNLGNQD